MNQSDTAVSLDQKWMQADVTTASPNASTLHAPLDRRVARAAQRNLDASRAISPPRRRMGSSDELARCVPPPAGPIAPTIFNAPKRRKRISGSEPRATQPSARRCALTPPLFASRCACSGAAARLHIHGAPTMLMRSCSARTVLQRIADTPTLLSFPTALPGAFGRLFASDY